MPRITKQSPGSRLLRASIHDDPPSAIVLVSSGRLDRDNETIDVHGLDFAGYLAKTPVVCLHHACDQLPIGKTTDLWIDTIDGADCLVAKVVFSTSNPQGRLAAEMVAEGSLSGASLSFLPIGPVTRNRWGGNHYAKGELLEWSLVTVPSNRDARVLVKGMRQKAGAAEDLLDGEEGEVRRERLREVLALLREYLRTSTSMTDGDKLRLAEAVSKLSSLVGPDPDAVAESKSARVAALKKSYAAADQALLDNPDLGENYKAIIKRFAERRAAEELTEEELHQLEQAVAELKAAEASLLHAVYAHTGKQFGELTGQANGTGRWR